MGEDLKITDVNDACCRKQAEASADEILHERFAGLSLFMSGTKPDNNTTLVVIIVDGFQ